MSPPLFCGIPLVSGAGAGAGFGWGAGAGAGFGWGAGRLGLGAGLGTAAGLLALGAGIGSVAGLLCSGAGAGTAAAGVLCLAAADARFSLFFAGGLLAFLTGAVVVVAGVVVAAGAVVEVELLAEPPQPAIRIASPTPATARLAERPRLIFVG
jgi:hypothetical protein